MPATTTVYHHERGISFDDRLKSGVSRAKRRLIFHGRFLRSEDFLVQNCANLRHALQTGLVRVRSEMRAVRYCENLRKTG